MGGRACVFVEAIPVHGRLLLTGLERCRTVTLLWVEATFCALLLCRCVWDKVEASASGGGWVFFVDHHFTDHCEETEASEHTDDGTSGDEASVIWEGFNVFGSAGLIDGSVPACGQKRKK